MPFWSLPGGRSRTSRGFAASWRDSSPAKRCPSTSSAVEGATNMSSSPSLSPSANPGREPGSHRPPPVALVIDDDLGVRESLHVILEEDFEVLEAVNGAAGLEVLRSRRVDVALLDVRMPGERGPAVLPRILALDENIPVILITAVPHVRTAVEAIKGGAYDYVIKPFDVDEILALVRQAAQQRVLEREVLYLRSELERAHGFDELVGRHPSMVRLYELIAQVAQTHATVLITAESGTGKELVARAIHRQSARRAQPFVAVNLADIPLLVDHFARKYSREFKKDVRGISRSALPALQAYSWPGNVRELENIIERSVALATHPVLQMEDLPLELALHEKGPGRGDREPSALTLKEARDRFEQAYVLRALEREDWNQSRAARRLGVHRNTLIARLAAWGIRPRDRGAAAPRAPLGDQATPGSSGLA